jgi:hypothetical protein
LKRAAGQPAARLDSGPEEKGNNSRDSRVLPLAAVGFDGGFSPIFAVLAGIRCQGRLFHFREKRHLHAAADNLTKAVPGANPRWGQERKKSIGARLGSRAAEKLCLFGGSLNWEARSSAGRRCERDS